MRNFTFILIFNLLIPAAFAQITGKVSNANSGEALMGAHVVLYHVDGQTLADHTITGKNGEFIFSGYYGELVNIQVSFIGFNIYQVAIQYIQEPIELNIQLYPAAVPVGEVTVNAVRKETMLKDVSIPMAIVTSTEIDKIGGFTPADMLKNEPGVALSRDGIWATSFNIRGLSEQRIVTLVDGNRVETATDLAAGMSMIDINDIERIEVIKGAASSLYGTGAMGGVVNIVTKPGHYSDGFSVGGGLSAAYQSVNSMHSENANLLLSDKKWYLKASGTYRDAQNTMTPKGELENSQFRDNNISFKAGIRPFTNHEIKLAYQRFYAKDVGLPGGEAFPAPALAKYSEIYRDMFSASYIIKNNGEILKDIEIKYFYQYISRDVIMKPNPATTVTPSGYHTTNGLQLQTSLNLPGRHSMIAGIDVWQRQLDTEREKNILQPILDSLGTPIGTNNIVRGELPIPHTSYTSGGLYFTDEYKAFQNRLSVQIGGRFDLIHVENDLAVDPLYLIMNGKRNDNPPNQRITFEAADVNNYSWSANLGMIYKLATNLDLTMNISRAFRSPSIEERYKYIDLGTKVRVGDPNLEPEDGYFSDLGIRLWGEKINLNVNGFVNSMRNLIVERPGSIIYNYTTDPAKADTLPALINANVDKALLYGFDMSFSYNVVGPLLLIGSSAYVIGHDVKNDKDLPAIPPFSGRLGLRYQGERWLRAEIFAYLTSDQDRIAAGETKTTGYSYYDFRLSTKALKTKYGSVSIFGGVENLTDRPYINHLASNRGSIRYEPGRNWFLRLKMEF